MDQRKLLPPAYLGATLAIMLVLHYLLPIARIVPTPYRYLGVLPIAARC